MSWLRSPFKHNGHLFRLLMFLVDRSDLEWGLIVISIILRFEVTSRRASAFLGVNLNIGGVLFVTLYVF